MRNELTGGFAGGELGLAYFKEKGDVPIAEDGQGTKQSSPLIIAFVLGLAATGGGLLLSTVEEVGLSVAEGSAATASLGLDDRTKAMLTVRRRVGVGCKLGRAVSRVLTACAPAAVPARPLRGGWGPARNRAPPTARPSVLPACYCALLLPPPSLPHWPHLPLPPRPTPPAGGHPAGGRDWHGGGRADAD